ncbi:MAG: hypothetical protein ACOCSL_00645 [Thermoplasmatota archaeon]
MEKKWKVYILLIVIAVWVILLSGIFPLPSYSWLVLTAITLIIYFALTRGHPHRKGDIEEVIKDMEDYMERKAENTEIEFEGVEKEEVKSEAESSSEKSIDEDSSDEEKKEDKYDFGDDVKIIKE